MGASLPLPTKPLGFDADEGLEDQPTPSDLGSQVEQYRVDEMDTGAGVREPGTVDAGTTAHVEDL